MIQSSSPLLPGFNLPQVPTVLPMGRFLDERGFMEVMMEEEVSAPLCIKRTLSKKGVIRGLHWQGGDSPQAKWIYLIQGAILDVTLKVVDDWPDPAQKHLVAMKQEEPVCLFVPPGYAHAYQTVSEESIVLYVCMGPYDAKAERSFHPLKWGIDWPVQPVIISRKDQEGLFRTP